MTAGSVVSSSLTACEPQDLTELGRCTAQAGQSEQATRGSRAGSLTLPGLRMRWGWSGRQAELPATRAGHNQRMLAFSVWPQDQQQCLE